MRVLGSVCVSHLDLERGMVCRLDYGSRTLIALYLAPPGPALLYGNRGGCIVEGIVCVFVQAAMASEAATKQSKDTSYHLIYWPSLPGRGEYNPPGPRGSQRLIHRSYRD
ncbi:hypothetical protein B0H67DRAFT_153987 [Lasiosphaeris hirsuta]|uniref:Uncharacterized protein n=1 Tax=Lasiosphaeris hirsuta TaxID=260670 RepID=A0AA40DX05_9PEZI|nr:hypothetical protein B0H67DRAFT_153987 [Lasiosphaeris hirsuta]